MEVETNVLDVLPDGAIVKVELCANMNGQKVMQVGMSRASVSDFFKLTHSTVFTDDKFLIQNAIQAISNSDYARNAIVEIVNM